MAPHQIRCFLNFQAVVLVLAGSLILHIFSFGFVYSYSRNKSFSEHFKNIYFKRFGGSPVDVETDPAPKVKVVLYRPANPMYDRELQRLR
jgi:hypothetical protein